MAVNVNDFKLFVEFCANKVQVGGTVSPSQFNLIANRAQMQLFERDRALFLQTKEISNYLRSFIKTTTLAVAGTGLLTYPADLFQTASIRASYTPPTGSAIQVPVDEIENTEWGRINATQLMPYTQEFPKYTEFVTQYRFLPVTIGSVTVDYFKQPVAPIWGFTVVSSRPVYDPGTSTNFEFNDYSTNEVAGCYLSLIGVNLKDNEVAAFAEMYKQQNSAGNQ